MKTSKAARLLLPALAALLVLAALPAMAGGARTRPGGSGSSSSPPTRVSGTARYGYAPSYAPYRYPYWRGSGYYGGYYGYGYGYWGWPWYYGYYRPVYYGPHVYRYVGNGKPPGTVETDVRPKKARVSVDGEPVGQARDYNGNWDLLYLDPGRHRVTFEAPDHMTLRLAIDVKPAAHHRIEFRLQKGEGIDPRSVETAAARAPTDEAPSSPPAAGEPQGLRTGLLSLRVLPPDAAVYLDGEFLAHADELRRLHGAIPVAHGQHTIEVVRPGFQDVKQAVVVEGSDPVRVEVELERLP